MSESREGLQGRISRDFLLGALIGAALGAVGSAISYFSARAAVKVRPNLAEVGFIDAALTNHGTDWLFYHEPVLASVGSVVFFALVVGGGVEVFFGR